MDLKESNCAKLYNSLISPLQPMRRDMRDIWDRHMFSRDIRIDGKPWEHRVIYRLILYIYIHIDVILISWKKYSPPFILFVCHLI